VELISEFLPWLYEEVRDDLNHRLVVREEYSGKRLIMIVSIVERTEFKCLTDALESVRSGNEEPGLVHGGT
jgi:hypothetical protein